MLLLSECTLKFFDHLTVLIWWEGGGILFCFGYTHNLFL